MKSFVCEAIIFFLLVSFGSSVKINQKCDFGIEVQCPAEPEEVPSVTCDDVLCSTSTLNTWLIGTLYKRVDCLEPFGQMVKVEYRKQGKLSCSLVSTKTDSELIESYMNPPPCETV